VNFKLPVFQTSYNATVLAETGNHKHML